MRWKACARVLRPVREPPRKLRRRISHEATRQFLSSLRSRLRIGADLHRESVRIDHMETGAASLLVNRSDPPRFEIRCHGFLLEVVDSDREMIHFGGWFTFAQDQKVLAEHELVIAFPLVYLAIEH